MRLIDADKLSNELATVCDDRYDRTVEWCIKVLQQAPTVDAVSREKYEASQDARKILVEFADDLLAELKERVEVVRCKDCKWVRNAGTLMGENPEPIYGCHHTGVYVFEDGYCDVGEKKEE